jgi:hypothetical protein
MQPRGTWRTELRDAGRRELIAAIAFDWIRVTWIGDSIDHRSGWPGKIAQTLKERRRRRSATIKQSLSGWLEGGEGGVD